MRTDLRKSEASVQGSIRDIADKRNQPLEEVLAEIEVIVYIDASSSMGYSDMQGKSKYDIAREALSDIQGAHPGKVLIISFANEAEVCLSGVPTSPSGGTAMDAGLEMGEAFDGTEIKHIVISDGEPNSKHSALAVADRFEDPIHTIFIGKESDYSALEFMKKLARNGEKSADRVEPEMLSETVMKLLTA